MLPGLNLTASCQLRRARQSKGCPISFEPLEGRQLLTVSFETFPGITSEHALSVPINLSRFSVTDESEQVRLTTSDGTAKAGVDYTAIDQVVTFGPGETTKTVFLTVFNDGQPEGDETINLTLDNPPSAPANPSYPSQMVLTIVDREDVTPPTVQNQQLLVTRSGAVKGIRLTFSEPMDVASVQNVESYDLSSYTLDRDGIGTIVHVPLHRMPMYDANTRIVTVMFDRPLRPSATRVTGSPAPESNGIRSNRYFFGSSYSPPNDLAGNPLGSFFISFSVGPFLSTTNSRATDFGFDSDGTVVFRIYHGGSLGWVTTSGVTGSASSDKSHLQLFNTNPRRTILTGRLVGAKVNAFGGNPLTIISPTRFINRLKNPPFEVTTIVTG